ncbi:MAG TPA: MoxR family ATPase [Candidatus Thermoplasmatota archaeon]|nr:MoxR family ATPase [Candidatus Thermoplasmatota archaeon]
MHVHVDALRKEVQKVIVGKRDIIDKVIVASLTEGAHILFEDMPGLAKSVLAATFSKAAGCQFNRIQFTPDLLPTDITGGHIFNRKTNEFDFRPGPIFTNFLLADEINRASPKTQSALLEAMAEKQVSAEGITHKLASPFLVLATQNPVEQEGTYPLPEAQMDRFAMKLSMGYPSKEEEGEIMNRRLTRKHDAFDTKAVMDRAQLLKMQQLVEEVHVDPSLVTYIAAIVDATRRHPDLVAGASPRGSLALMKLARSYAAIQGRRYVIPDDVRAYASCTLAHRTILTTEARVRGMQRERVIQDILAKVPVPRPQGG